MMNAKKNPIPTTTPISISYDTQFLTTITYHIQPPLAVVRLLHQPL